LKANIRFPPGAPASNIRVRPLRQTDPVALG
jgi:hypothetical protein